jgi:hypothetical protein
MKMKGNGRSERTFTEGGAERHSIIVLEGSQSSPASLSDKGSTKAKTLG